MAVKMMIPPIVGVPAFAWCSCGPSSRMCWPNSRARRNWMNLGDRKMQMSSEAVPPIRTSPISRRLPRSPVPVCRAARRGGERLGHDLEPDPARPLDEHHIARLDQSASERRRARRVRHPMRLALEPGCHLRRQRADRDQQIHARLRGVGADLAVALALSRAELEHVAEHGDAAPRGSLPGEVIQGGAHRDWVGVVAVVDDERPARQLDACAPQRGEDHVDAARRLHADRPRRGHRRERVVQVVREENGSSSSMRRSPARIA